VLLLLLLLLYLECRPCYWVLVGSPPTVTLLVLCCEHQHQCGCHDCLPEQHYWAVGLPRLQCEACCAVGTADADNHQCLIPGVHQKILAELLHCCCCSCVCSCLLYLIKPPVPVCYLDEDETWHAR
jgi:hypothetical protein